MKNIFQKKELTCAIYSLDGIDEVEKKKFHLRYTNNIKKLEDLNFKGISIQEEKKGQVYEVVDLTEHSTKQRLNKKCKKKLF